MKNEMTADEFKVGDKVYCAIFGEGKVIAIKPEDVHYPVIVEFFNHDVRCDEYTYDGRLYTYANRSLFFSEPKIEASVTRPFVSKLIGKKVVVNTEYDLCVIGVVEIENSEYLTIDDCHYAKEELKAVYEVTSDNLL